MEVLIYSKDTSGTGISNENCPYASTIPRTNIVSIGYVSRSLIIKFCNLYPRRPLIPARDILHLGNKSISLDGIESNDVEFSNFPVHGRQSIRGGAVITYILTKTAEKIDVYPLSVIGLWEVHGRLISWALCCMGTRWMEVDMCMRVLNCTNSRMNFNQNCKLHRKWFLLVRRDLHSVYIT